TNDAPDTPSPESTRQTACRPAHDIPCRPIPDARLPPCRRAFEAPARFSAHPTARPPPKRARSNERCAFRGPDAEADGELIENAYELRNSRPLAIFAPAPERARRETAHGPFRSPNTPL